MQPIPTRSVSEDRLGHSPLTYSPLTTHHDSHHRQLRFIYLQPGPAVGRIGSPYRIASLSQRQDRRRGRGKTPTLPYHHFPRALHAAGGGSEQPNHRAV